MSGLDSLFDQAPDQPQNVSKKNSLDTAFDLAPDNNSKAAPTIPTDTSAVIAEPIKKFPDVMPGGQALGVEKQDATKPVEPINPSAGRWGELDFSKGNDKNTDITAKTPLEAASAFSGEMGRSLAPLFHGVDYLQTELGDQLKNTLFGKTIAATINIAKDKGIPDASHPFKLLYEAMNYAANGPQMPEGTIGEIAKGTAGAIPQVLAAWVAPELTIAPLLEKWGLKVLAKAGLGTVSKFGAVMGGQATIESIDANQNSSPMQKMTVPLIKGAEQYITGVFYDMGGIVSSRIGARVAEKAFPEYVDGALSKAEKMKNPFAHPDLKLSPSQSTSKMLVNGLTTTAFNSNIIGGYGSLVEFLSTGETSWKTYKVGVGTGLALSGREVGKLIGAKMTNSLVAATPEMIQNTINSPTSSEESFAYARDKFNSISTSKNPEGAAAEGLLATRVGMLKAAIEEIQFNPTDMLKSVEESTTMPQEMKDHLTESINSIVANGDKAVVEAKPLNDQIAEIDKIIDSYKKNSNLAPADQEFKIKSMAAKREGLYNKVIAIHEKYARTRTPLEEKTAQAKLEEDTKQANIIQSKAAIVFPQFQERLKTLADGLGAETETRLKASPSITGKTTRQGSEVKDVSDIIGGVLILPDLKSFKNAAKKIKAEFPDATFSNKRLPNKETGWQGVTANMIIDGVPTEIQLHTKDTFNAHQEALKLTNPWRNGVPPEPGIKTNVVLGDKTSATDAEKRVLGITQKEDSYKVGDNVTLNGKEYTIKEITTGRKGQQQLVLDVGLRTDAELKNQAINNVANKHPETTLTSLKDIEQAYPDEVSKEFAKIQDIELHNTERTTTVNAEDVVNPNVAKSNDAFTLPITKDGKDIGKATIEDHSDGWRIKWIEVDRNGKNRGDGRDAMRLLNEEARKEGKVLISDLPATKGADTDKNSGDMKSAWNKLVDSGEAEQLPDGSWKFKTKETQQDLYEAAMDQSRTLYNDAYKPLENTNLEGSPAKTVAQRRMRELGIPMEQQKELNKAWTEMKGKLVGELKDKNIETKAAFKEFLKGLPNLSGLDIKLQTRMLAKVNSIDFTKPGSLPKAVDYFENIVNRATWRYDEVKTEQAIGILTDKGQKSLNKKAPNQPSKNIKGAHGLPLWDELGIIDDNMHNKSWAEGQQKIKEIENKYTSEQRPPTLEELNQITEYDFWGALNFNNENEGSSHYYQGVAKALISVRKQGYSEAAAKKMFEAAQKAETMKGRLDAMNGRSLTPKELEKLLDTRFTENKQKTLFDRLNNATNWPITSSFVSRIEFLAQNDKTSAPYQGILYESLVKPMEIADLGNFIDTRDWRNELSDKASEVFGTKPGRQTWKNAADRTKTVYEVKFKNLVGEDDMLPITMNQAVTVYMQLQDPTLEKSHEAGYYKRNGELTSLGQGVLDVLTPQAKAWGDHLINEFYPKMYERLNPVYRMLYGRDMPFNSLYSPIFIQGVEGRGPVSEDLLGNQGFVSGLKNGSLLDRVKHAKVLNLADADRVAESYLHNMAYWKNYTEGIQNLNEFIKDPAIRNTIKQNFPNGEDHLRYLEQKVQIYLRKPSDAWMIRGTFSKVRDNILLSSLMGKILVGGSQISSAPAFAEYMPALQIPKYSIESLYNWLGDKGNIAMAKKFWNDPYMQQRYQEGWDNVLTGILGADIHSVGNKIDWRSKLMFPTKYGDFSSVLMGGIPVYRYHFDEAMKKFGNEKMAHIQAMQIVREATGSTQQSGLGVDLAPIQEANPVFKAITMFKSAPFQYQRKVAAATRNLISGRGSAMQNIKVLALYHVLLPSLFQFMSNGFKWDTKEQIRAGALGPYNDLLAYGDIAEGLWNVYQGQSWKKYNASPVLTMYDDAEKTVTHLAKVRPSDSKLTKGLPAEYIPQLMKAAEGHRWNMLETGKTLLYFSKVVGEGFGLPVPAVSSIGKGIYDVATGETEGKSVGHKALRILGKSEYSLQDAVDDSDMTAEQVELLSKPIKGPTKNKPPVKTKPIPNF